MIYRVILLFMISILPSWAVRDGAWNGKPFKKDVLEAGVAKGQPGALAEWAYCSLFGLNEIPHDLEKLTERAEKAAKAQDPLGLFVLGAIYEQGFLGYNQDAKSLRFIQASAKTKHPMAIWKLGVYYRLGIKGVEKDPAKGIAMIQQALKDGCISAHISISIVYRTGELGEIDTELAAESLKKLLSYGYPDGAEEITRIRLKERNHRALYPFFKKEDFDKAERLLAQAAKLGHPHSSYYLGYMHMREGRPHQGIPLLLRSADHYQAAHPSLVSFASRRFFERGSKTRCVSKDYQTDWKIANKAYEFGRMNNSVKRLVADSILSSNKRRKHPREEEGLNLLKEMINKSPRGNCNASHSLARFLSNKYFFQKGATRQDFKRGMAHYELHGRCATSSHWLGMFYGREHQESQNIPKALAALHRAVEVNTGGWRHAEKQLQKKLLAKASPEQKKQAEDLISQEWPHGKEHRKRAFLYLQKLGDIPAGKKFDPKFRFPEGLGDL